jgi:hypothetical protein
VATREPFPVLCDRCEAEGLAGEAEFERLAGLGDLLDFEPVPRRVARADGWTPDIQRAYVAALAVTGSERQAAAVVERAQFGVTQLRKAEGNESFLAACDKALELYRERERVRRSDNLLAAAHGETARRRGRPPLAWSGAATRRRPDHAPPDPAQEERDKIEALEAVFRHYRQRLGFEREARLAGRAAEADFYLRQITVVEVCMDLLCVNEDAMRRIRDLSVEGHHVNDIAETVMSRLLDETRRDRWAELGEPERPPLPGPDAMIDKGGYKLLKQEVFHGGPDLQAQYRARDEERRAAARAQVEWEAKARRDYEERRDRDASS